MNTQSEQINRHAPILLIDSDDAEDWLVEEGIYYRDRAGNAWPGDDPNADAPDDDPYAHIPDDID